MKIPPSLSLLASLLILAPLHSQEPDRSNSEKEGLMQQARKAKEEGRFEDAENLTRKAKQQQGEPREPKVRKEGEERHGDRFAQMKREIGELRSAGKHEEAQRLERELKEAWGREHSERSHGDTSQFGDRKGPAQLAHLMEAIQHLRAAGMNDVAENLEQNAKRMREEFERQAAQQDEKKESPEGSKPGSSDEVRQLRAQMQKLAHELESLREDLKRQRGEAVKKE